MHRVTITLDDDIMAELDRMIEARGYQNRSEAVRDLVRAGIRQANEKADPAQDCVAALVYVYDHEARELAKRLTRSFHDHHDLSLAAMHVHLDHESCMEVTVLQGKTRDVQSLADQVIAERGVRHGRVFLVPVDIERQKHPHGVGSTHRHPHVHVRKAG
ncbi:MAG TPA: nickel-responsive transcriptional regulator NikR [Stellaceae bacterium]|nr:nickel-responsive transcriptional regulator NikR [Stellaceae bacterium]